MTSIFTFTRDVTAGAKFSAGVPLPKGRFFVEQELALETTQGIALRANIKAVVLWPDHSIKWLQCTGIVLCSISQDTTVKLVQRHKSVVKQRQDWVKKENQTLLINTQVGNVVVDLNNIATVSYLGNIQTSPILELDAQSVAIDKVKTEYETYFSTDEEPLYCIVDQVAAVQFTDSNKELRLRAKYIIYYHDASITTQMSLHNSQAIVASDGQWDLGNESSVYISDFGVKLSYDARSMFARLQAYEECSPYESLSLIQYSSGGDHWDSENHKTRFNKVSLKQKGAVANIVEDNANKQITIDRANPSIQLAINDKLINIDSKHFWEKYPASILSTKNHTELKFADIKSECEVELQGGEIKSHSFELSVRDNSDSSYANQSIPIKLCEDNLIASQALLYMHTQNNALLVPIQEWQNKRERLDEYGWRNYGDIYADHEAAHYQGEGIFVSHYNNQYDPLYGFLKQWLVTGKQEYKQLADELFDHIVNIDIYHTNKDKPEYNDGLFWHTDHYVPAETATHRTYSKHQETGVYMDHAGGGGPGPHHCYSSGLALYFLLTGNTQAQSVTLNLAKWMQHIYEGDSTLLGLVLRMKNANYLKIPFTNKLLLGFGTGVVRNVFNQRYPLDRGTGNLVNVLLDSFQVSGRFAYITQAEFVIMNTISDTDDISTRQFDDIENTWFYTVFLQAVCKYLFLVSQFSPNNGKTKVDVATVLSIKKAFLHYATWMSENEKPYLNSAEKLEYPNDTWTGQDLRKIQVLLCGYELTQNPNMLKKADELSAFVLQKLNDSHELAFARIQALIMQNTIEKSAIKGMFANLAEFDDLESLSSQRDPQSRFNKPLISRLMRFIKNYSPSHELNILCVRIPVFKKIFNK